jgi:hypothetical protein
MLKKTAKRQLQVIAGGGALKKMAKTQLRVIAGAKKNGGANSKVVIKEPLFQVAALRIRGTAPYVQHAFSEKSKNTMIETQEAGQQAQSKRKRAPKDFDALYHAAMHIARQGWNGIPAPAFRNAMISACRTVGFKMTLAKLSVFVEADGFDRLTGEPLVKITKGKPQKHWATARNDNGSTDVRCRPMWPDGWEATVRVRWDADQFSAVDVVNLFSRAGAQVGIGEGRADSPNSAGLGWGFFMVMVKN